VAKVLIVGAGPTGLTLACDLLNRRIPFRIIDKAPEPTKISKAIVVHARNLEMLEKLDSSLLDEFLAHGHMVRGSNIFSQGKRIVHLNFDELESSFKFVLAISQAKTEELLSQYLAKNEIHVERELELVLLKQEGESVEVVLHKIDAAGETLASSKEQFDYVVGCDGAHSRVRKSLCLDFVGANYEEIFGAADVAIDYPDFQEDEAYAYFSESGVLACFPFGNKRYRLIFDMPKELTAEGHSGDKHELEMATVEKVLLERSGLPNLKASDPQWLAWFRIHRRVVKTYSQGRVFLAGDAAHIHSPVGGVGMNTGMQDAINLSWKLALVLKGMAKPELLATYSEERHTVGQSVLKGTHLATKVVTLRNPVGQTIRNKVMGFLTGFELVQERILRAGSLIGIGYRESALSQEAHLSLEQSVGRSLHIGGFKEEEEKPGLASWIDFARAPVAGDRAPDGECRTGTGVEKRLFQLMATPRFALLLFDGNVASQPGYENFAAIEQRMAKEFGALVDVHVIVPYAKDGKVLPLFKSVIYDDESQLHTAYGASSECLYLVRPDGYIGYRSQPADLEGLLAYLKSYWIC
jgi:2-polyprenyl-6-methoxyphenol hydroxylase-like FAD-dependent oxidoreductase